MEADNKQLTNINYDDLNSQYGNVSVSDEEDVIEKHAHDKKSKTINIYERQIKLK